MSTVVNRALSSLSLEITQTVPFIFEVPLPALVKHVRILETGLFVYVLPAGI